MDWLDAAGLPNLARHPRQTFDHFFVTRQAVEDGVGISVGPLPMLAIDVASNKVATPLLETRVRRTGHEAVVPKHVDRALILGTLVDWLGQEASRAVTAQTG
jgi:LysR family glycine cleavage system transcriptional activator